MSTQENAINEDCQLVKAAPRMAGEPVPAHLFKLLLWFSIPIINNMAHVTFVIYLWTFFLYDFILGYQLFQREVIRKITDWHCILGLRKKHSHKMAWVTQFCHTSSVTSLFHVSKGILKRAFVRLKRLSLEVNWKSATWVWPPPLDWPISALSASPIYVCMYAPWIASTNPILAFLPPPWLAQITTQVVPQSRGIISPVRPVQPPRRSISSTLWKEIISTSWKVEESQRSFPAMHTQQGGKNAQCISGFFPVSKSFPIFLWIFFKNKFFPEKLFSSKKNHSRYLEFSHEKFIWK